MTKSPTNGGSENEKSAANEALREKWQPIHDKLLGEMWKIWSDHRADAKELDPAQFQRFSVVTMTQMAAVLAVDCNLTEQQFLDVCKSNFEGAYDRAPKWGD